MPLPGLNTPVASDTGIGGEIRGAGQGRVRELKDRTFSLPTTTRRDLVRLTEDCEQAPMRVRLFAGRAGPSPAPTTKSVAG